MDILKIIEILNQIAPEKLQENWDNSGIQINTGCGKDIKKIMTCLEISDRVIEEAIQKKADMIITHHPLIFSKLGRLDENDVTGRQIITLIKNNISVYSSHTAFDSAEHGTNQDLAEQLGLDSIAPLEESLLQAGCGMGRYGSYKEPIGFSDFLSILQRTCSEADIRVAGARPQSVKTVALCTGAGAEFIDEAKALGADVYITGDVKYHDARHADDIGFCVIDAGHYGTEILFADNMAKLLCAAPEMFGTEIFPSETDINPFH